MQQTRSMAHFTDLDGMRGVLAVVVMLFHIGLNPLLHKVTHGIVEGGAFGLCVDFFFILSGFVLYFSLDRSRPSLSQYFVKRVRRLAPVFLIGMLAMLAMQPHAYSWWEIALNIAMVQSIFGQLSIDFPGWSLPFELYLPALALPVLGGALTRPVFGAVPRITPVAGALVLVATLFGAMVVAVMFAFGHDWPAARAFCGLALGMALGRIRQRRPLGRALPHVVIALFVLAILVMVVTLRLPIAAATFPLISSACIYLGAQTRTFLSGAPCQALGRWSYSIYLAHIPMLTLVSLTLGSPNGNVVLKGVIVIATIAFAALSFRLIEMPFMKRRPLLAQTAP